MTPSRRATWAGLLLPLVTACGGEPTASGGDVGAVAQQVVDGYVDDATTGVVGLAVDFPGHFFFGHCSGTLIAPNLVLTARHCVSLTQGTPDERVQCGVSTFSQPDRGDIFLASPATVRPTTGSDPAFFRSVDVRVPDGSSEFCGNDVALIVLEGAGIPAELATPIVPRVDGSPAPGERFSAVGFGLTLPDGGDAGGTRMRSDSMTVRCSGLDCRAQTDLVRTTEWLSLDARVCPGDSGGPALDEQGRVMGVTSRGGDGCHSAIYGDVGSWRDFVIPAAKDAASRGGYPAPFWTAGVSTAPTTEAPGGDAGTGTDAGALLGSPCSGACGGGYACYADEGVPPGICVPRCGAGIPDACPGGYQCATGIGACVPAGSSVLAPSRDPGGCAVARRDGGGGASLLAALGACLAGLGLRARGRRRVTGARA